MTSTFPAEYHIQISSRSYVVARGDDDLRHELQTMKVDGIDVLRIFRRVRLCRRAARVLLVVEGPANA